MHPPHPHIIVLLVLDFLNDRYSCTINLQASAELKSTFLEDLAAYSNEVSEEEPVKEVEIERLKTELSKEEWIKKLVDELTGAVEKGYRAVHCGGEGVSIYIGYIYSLLYVMFSLFYGHMSIFVCLINTPSHSPFASLFFYLWSTYYYYTIPFMYF